MVQVRDAQLAFFLVGCGCLVLVALIVSAAVVIHHKHRLNQAYRLAVLELEHIDGIDVNKLVNKP